jgi:hypothetical protein
MSASVIPLGPPDPAPGGDWQSLEVVVPRRLPRIPPGIYEGVSVGLRRYEFSRRPVLRLDLDVFAAAAFDSEILARLPYYMRWTGKKPAPTSKLGRLLHVARLEPSRGRPVSLTALKGRLWRIRVDDAQHDSQGQPLTEATTYSVVSSILELLT